MAKGLSLIMKQTWFCFWHWPAVPEKYVVFNTKNCLTLVRDDRWKISLWTFLFHVLLFDFLFLGSLVSAWSDGSLPFNEQMPTLSAFLFSSQVVSKEWQVSIKSLCKGQTILSPLKLISPLHGVLLQLFWRLNSDDRKGHPAWLSAAWSDALAVAIHPQNWLKSQKQSSPVTGPSLFWNASFIHSERCYRKSMVCSSF